MSFKQTLSSGLLGAAFGAVGEGIASSGILGKAFNFGKKKILGLVDDFIPKGPAMAEAGTGMKMSADVAENMGKVELGKIEQTAVQKNYNAIMNPSKAIASTTDDVAEQVLVKSADDVAERAVVSSADDVAGRAIASSTDDIAVSATAGSRQAEKQLLSGSEWNEYFQQTYGAENVQWVTQGQSSLAKGVGKADENIVYRALNRKDAERLGQGLGLEAKNPTGTWKLDEHLVGGSGRTSWAKDPFISTTSDINVAREFNQLGNNLGIVKIDLNKVSSQTLKGYEIYPRVNGVEGLPYHYSIWQQEVSVYQSIPIEAIKGFVK